MKNSWKRPELVVLVRRNSDEVILQACKEASGDPNMSQSICQGAAIEECGQCSISAPV